MWEESQLVVERINNMLATQTVLTNAAIGTVAAAFGKDGAKAHLEFQKLIKRLSGDGGTPDTPKKRLADKIAQERQGNG